MKKLLWFFAAVIAAECIASVSTAQIVTSFSHVHHDQSFSSGRDFWLAEMTHDWGVDSAGGYMRIYITSPHNTEAYIAHGNVLDSVSITAYSVASYLIPNFLQLESSGIIENKALHVWSDDADLIVSTMNAVPYSADGCSIIPTIGWGKDYVVAAYQSLFFPNEQLYDLPSSCAVVANQDNTSIDITPSCDCRRAISGTSIGDSSSAVVAFAANQTFTAHLNRGEAMQLLPVNPTSIAGFDMTGTIIHADRPVGVFGGSSAPNIPDTFPFADHVEEMIPPIRTWGKTYMGTSYHQPPGEPPGKDYAMYLLISSKPDQIIFRHNCISGTDTEAVFSKAFSSFWAEEEGGQMFFSNSPFLCIEYMNSSTYPDGENGNGDPAMGRLTPREQFLKTDLFIAPTTGTSYYNYANITVNAHDETHTFFDGHPLNTVPSQCIDGSWEIFTINNISAGPHPITGDDSGVSVYLYGYGYDESYAQGTAQFVGTFNSPDTVPPAVDTFGTCFERRIHVRDSGMLPNRVDSQSGIAMVRLDSLYNMSFVPNPDFMEGADADTTGYSVTVIDQTRPGIVIATVFDAAGNSTRVQTQYIPNLVTMIPAFHPVGIQKSGDPPVIAYDTIVNTGTLSFKLTELHLLYGNRGFSLHDSIGGPLDLSPIKPHNYRTIEILFTSVQPTIAIDSIIYGNACEAEEVAIAGSGGANDFLVSDVSWPQEPLPPPAGGYIEPVSIWSFSSDTIKIDSIWWGDKSHFRFAIDSSKTPPVPMNSFPLVLPPFPAKIPCYIAFYPDSLPVIATEAHWSSPSVLNGNVRRWKTDSLIGLSGIPKEIFTGDTIVFDSCGKVGSIERATLWLSAVGNYPSTIKRITQSNTVDFQPLHGTIQNIGGWDPETVSQTIPTGYTAQITLYYIYTTRPPDTIFDTIRAFDGNGNLIDGKPIVVGFNVVDRSLTLPTIWDFGPVSFPGPPDSMSWPITNSGNAPVTFYSAQLTPSPVDSGFTVTTSPTCPCIIPPGGSMQVQVIYANTKFESASKTVYVLFEDNDCGGNFTEPVTVEIAYDAVAQAHIVPFHASVEPNGSSLEVLLPGIPEYPTTFDLYDVLGRNLYQTKLTTSTSEFEVGMLPDGIYFWRIVSGQHNKTGKIILGE